MTPGPKPKLTREQALEIRDSYGRGVAGMTTLAARYGVSIQTISTVIKGKYSTVKGEADIARQGLRSVPGKYSLRPPS